MRRQRGRVLCLLVRLLILAVALLEAPELATLTNNTSNDPAPIESTQTEVLRSAITEQFPIASPSPAAGKPVRAPDLQVSLCVLPCAAGQALLRLLVLQRK